MKGNYMIGDAAYRVANARVILFSRDPHLAAIGMTWMPLSTLATLPFVVVLEPFGLGWASGTMMSACFGAGTIVMLARLARQVQASHAATAVVLFLYALNPVTVFWMGSAMMEAPTLFFLTWACVAWIRWLEGHQTNDLAVVGVALGLGVLSRYEQVLVTAAFCALALLAERKGRRLATATMVAVPSVAGMAVWMAVNLLIRGDALAFIRSPKSSFECAAASAPLPISLRNPAMGINDWCDVNLSLIDGIRYAAQRVGRFAPALALAPFMLARDLRRRVRSSAVLAVLVATLITPLLVAWLTAHEKGTGNPRYFLAAAVAVPMLCLIAAGWKSRWQYAWYIVATALLAAGIATSTRMELTQRYAGMENEQDAISNLTGLQADLLDDAGVEEPERVAQWRAAAAEIDRLTTGDDLIALDSSTSFNVLLFTRHLDRFAIPENRDFEQLLSLADTRFSFVVVSGSTTSATGVDGRLAELVASTSGHRSFDEVADLPGVGRLFRRVEVDGADASS